MAMGDQAEDQIVAVMKRFGYTGSDARTYIALLQTNPATGYELASRGGIPRSAIYGVLKRLEQSGLVNALAGKPARYIPMPPNHLVEHLQSRFARDLDNFSEAVARITGPRNDTLTWTVTGYDALLAEAESLIGHAEKSVVCSLWRKEADRLSRALSRAKSRDVDITLFSFTDLPEHLGRVLSYHIDPRELEEHWSRRLIVITDNGHALVGAADGTRLDRGVISDEPVLVEMAIANLVLDITLWGERKGVSTNDIVTRMTSAFAPIDALTKTE